MYTVKRYKFFFSFGVFVPKLKEYFECGSGETGTITAIQMGVTFASGPIASYMTNRLGWRLTTVIGSILATAGLCFSAVAPSVVFLYFTAGGLVGWLNKISVFDFHFQVTLKLFMMNHELDSKTSCLTSY